MPKTYVFLKIESWVVKNASGCFVCVFALYICISNVFMRYSFIFCIYENIDKSTFGFFVILIQDNGWYCIFRKEETKLVCAISRKVASGVEKHFSFA